MNLFKTIALLCFITGCAPIHIHYDFDKDVDFSKYKTYHYFADIKTGLSDLDTKRFINALNLKMKAKGFHLSEKPDFFIDIKSTEYQKTLKNTIGVGVGGNGRNIGGGISIGIPMGKTSINRQITIDFLDENGIGLFWKATSESSFNPNATPQVRETRINAIIEKMLSKYPPKQ